MTKTMALAAGLALLALASAPAAAQPRLTDTVVGSCVYSFGAAHCVRQFRYGDPGNSGIFTRKEINADDAADAQERERRWVERCRPRVVQDSFGVGRYVYAARGCEFGMVQD